jgi:zinc ribbon protein/FHA domain-containing protein
VNCRVCGSELPDGAMFCGECGSSVTATRIQRPAARDPRPSDTTIIAPLPRPAVAGPRSTVHSVPVPQPHFTAATEHGAQTEASQEQAVASDSAAKPEPAKPEPAQPEYRLIASTGEEFSITGSGLLGRRPIAQPGESIDQFVPIADTGRSVSKTHLEFGIEAGELWICDRYSANGTVIVPAGAAPRMCEPGRRYRVEHGSRIEIGDQYLDVT